VGTHGLFPLSPANTITTNQELVIAQEEYQLHNKIIISSDADFELQGWPGYGTETDPFVISGLNISDASTCIRVTETTAYFVIEDCLFSGFEPDACTGIFLSDLDNGIVRNNNLVSCGIQLVRTQDTVVSNNQIDSRYTDGIIQQQCSDSQIRANVIDYSESDGIRTESSTNCIFTGNVISHCVRGIAVVNEQFSVFTFNCIRYTSSYGIEIASGSYNIIYANLLYTEYHAIDNGQSNLWDDSQSIGNWWQYRETGIPITVVGTAGSIDRYPLEVQWWGGWFWHDLPATYQFGIPYGNTANQDKVGWIIWNYPGSMTVHRNETLVLNTTLRYSGVYFLDAALLSDGTHNFDFSITGEGHGAYWAQYTVNVIDGLFVTYTEAPENLAVNVTGNQLDLTWSSPSSNGGNPIVGYIVYRGTRPGEMEPIATLGLEVQFQDDLSILGPFVFYAVSAVNGLGEGEISDYVCNLIFHDRIVIDETSDFLDQGWSGDGTDVNPFLISDVIIRSNITAISIIDVDAFFVIENCWITHEDSWRGDTPGIEFVNVSNGIIRSSVSSNKEHGVRLSSSRNCIITNCTSYNNEKGISIQSSENCTIEKLQLDASSYYGVGLHINESRLIEVTDCQLYSNQWRSNGINVYSSENCTFTNCTFQSLLYAVRMDTCQNSLMTQSWFNRCRYAFSVFNSLDISLTDSEINYHNQAESGFQLDESTLCKFLNVSLSNTSISIDGYNKTHWNHFFSNVSINDKPYGYFFDVDNTSIDCNLYTQCLISYCTNMNLTGSLTEFVDYGIRILNSSSLYILDFSRDILYIRNSSSIEIHNMTIGDLTIVNSNSILTVYSDIYRLEMTNSIGCHFSYLILSGPDARSSLSSCSNIRFDHFELQFNAHYRWYNIPLLSSCTNVSLQSGRLNCSSGDTEVFQSSKCEFTNVQIINQIRIRESNSTILYNCQLTKNYGTNIFLDSSYNSTVEDCSMIGAGLEIFGEESYLWNHRIVDSTLNGLPILYIIDQSDIALNGQEYGQLILVGCSRINLGYLTFWDTSHGLQLAYCSQIEISEIELWGSIFPTTFNTPQIFECDNFLISQLSYYNHSARFLLRNCADSVIENSIFFWSEGVGLDGDSINCTIRNCHFQDSYGIHSSGGTDCKIIGNTFLYGFQGIRIYGGESLQISYNSLDSDSGIYLEPLHNSIISYNSIMSSRQRGLYLTNCENNTYLGNRIFHSSIYGVQIWNERNAVFAFNEIKDNNDGGLECNSGSFNQFYGNLFARNGETNVVDNGIDNEWDDGVSVGNCWEFSKYLIPRSIPGSAHSTDNYPLVVHDRELVSPVIAHRYNVSTLDLGNTFSDITWCVWGAPGVATVFVNGLLVSDESYTGCGTISISVSEYGNANYTLMITDLDGNIETCIIDTGAEIRYLQGITVTSLGTLSAGFLVAVAIIWDWKRRTKRHRVEREKEENKREELLQALNDLKSS
jgi:parallel beta-helix repeat protein